MACPYFYPVERRVHDSSSRSAMLPLGDVWTGFCRAPLDPVYQPDHTALHTMCALGYARGRCPRFVSGDNTPDAVRFSIRGDDGLTLHLLYVLERDHHPLAHGPLEYSRGKQAFSTEPPADILSRQAEAYVTSYLRRKSEAAPR